MDRRLRVLVVGIAALGGFLVGSSQAGSVIAIVLAVIAGTLGLAVTGALDERARARRVEESGGGRG